MPGPLAGLKVLEMAGVGPGPFCATMLADHGAEVIRIERPKGIYAASDADPSLDVMTRSRRVLVIDLKTAAGVAVVRQLCTHTHALVEGFRPGVMERLGLGPENVLGINPAIVYGRATGWGQQGPLAKAPGHDINYIGLAGVLSALGRKDEKPTPALNLIGDYAGGGLMLAFGLLAAIHHARQTGRGQVVDSAMVDGAAMIGSVLWTFQAQGIQTGPRGCNLFDTGAHFYDTYECADGEFVSVGPVEPQFYAQFCQTLDIVADPQGDCTQWPRLKQKLTAVFLSRTRDEWCELFAHTEGCVSPVLSVAEAPLHPHNVARDTFVEVAGHIQPAPAPRYSASVNKNPTAPRREVADEILAEVGYSAQDIASLTAAGIVR